jgi:O-acetyl-ADP-ribose deacetylase (regulator of RNase III)
VLVCSGPKDLQLSNGGLSQALLEVAGDEMQEELDNNYADGIDFGEHAISKGFNLNCKYVYHVAVPKWGTNTPDPSYVRIWLINWLFIAFRFTTQFYITCW